ncbi:MAG: class I SAM-dependent methyltransferase [Candidatus Accumulibacter sp.]|jgi:SAM-dependent methyltransferase|nr:class I SAM-dependent methyltransferase [Accumulibacter sp.]
MPSKPHVELEFSRKYDLPHAENYFSKHRTGWARRLSNWRETQIARKAIHRAGDPVRVLDLPCGAGRFWPMLLEKPDRMLLAADYSPDMLDTARRTQAQALGRVRIFQTSAFDVGLEDAAVDCVFCMRFLHHIGLSEHRLALLREFHRVTRESMVISLWVDGNFKAWKRKRLEARRACADGVFQNRFVIEKARAESEFRQAGFEVVDHVDFLPAYALWRIYVLRKKFG